MQVVHLFETGASADMVPPLKIDLIQVFQTIFIILGLPLLLGIAINTKFPKFTAKVVGPIKKASVLIFTAIVIIALAKNFDHFINIIQYIFAIVLIHNALALLTGYSLASIFKLSKPNRRSITIETGIQNSSLALVLIFNPKIFPPELELGGMAVIAAWWGIWHMIAGLGIASFWGSSFSFLGLKKSNA